MNHYDIAPGYISFSKRYDDDDDEDHVDEARHVGCRCC